MCGNLVPEIILVFLASSLTRARLRPVIKASYSAWLLVVGKENCIDILTLRHLSFSSIRPAPLLLKLKDLSVNTVNLVHDSLGCGVSSARKSENTCALSVLRTSKLMSSSNSPINHLVILPAKYGMNTTCFSGWYVRTTIGCAKKYLISFLDATINTKRIFSIF